MELIAINWHGEKIDREMVEVKDRNGDTTRVARYYFVEENA